MQIRLYPEVIVQRLKRLHFIKTNTERKAELVQRSKMYYLRNQLIIEKNFLSLALIVAEIVTFIQTKGIDIDTSYLSF